MQISTKRPTPKTVTYNQDDLSDFTANGGSIIELFREEIDAGNIVFVVQEPYNAPSTVIAVITQVDDLAKLKEANEKMSAWLANVTGSKPPKT